MGFVVETLTLKNVLTRVVMFCPVSIVPLMVTFFLVRVALKMKASMFNVWIYS